MLQPLTHDLQFPFAEELAKSYGPYLEKLAKDDKYGLIGSLAYWLQLEAEAGCALEVSEKNFNSLFSAYSASTEVEEILRKYLSQLNEPIIHKLMLSLIQQLREGYYRTREVGELEYMGMDDDDLESIIKN